MTIYNTDSGIHISYCNSSSSRHMLFIIDNQHLKANILHRVFSLELADGFFNIICDSDFFVVSIPYDEAKSGEFVNFALSVEWDFITELAKSELKNLRG